MTEFESKAEARKRNRRELAHKGIKIGLRTPKSAKAQHDVDQLRVAKCLCCGNVSHKCICSGHMSEAAMNRFFQEQKEGKKK